MVGECQVISKIPSSSHRLELDISRIEQEMMTSESGICDRVGHDTLSVARCASDSVPGIGIPRSEAVPQ